MFRSVMNLLLISEALCLLGVVPLRVHKPELNGAISLMMGISYYSEKYNKQLTIGCDAFDLFNKLIISVLHLVV